MVVDPINLKTTLSQIDNVQRVQNLKQKEHDNAQKEFVKKLMKEEDQQKAQVNAASESRKKSRVDERKEKKRRPG